MKAALVHLPALAFLASVVGVSACSGGTGNPASGSAGADGQAGNGSAGAGGAGDGAAGTGNAGGGAASRDAGVDAAPGGDASVDHGDDASGDGPHDATSLDEAPLKDVAGAVILSTTGNEGLIGTATFRNDAGIVSLSITVIEGCPAGPHNFYLHLNDVCGTDGMAAGGRWTPKGDTNLGVVTCLGNGTGSGIYVTPSVGYWTIGGDVSTNILNHALVIYGSATEPTARIGCGVPQ
jgi:hypothetical protein